MSNRPIVDEIPVSLTILVIYLAMSVAVGVFDTDSDKLIALGALRGGLVAHGDLWRLLAYAFLHGGIVHLAMNTFALMALGPALERAIGSLRFIALYVVTAVSGGVLAVLWNGAEDWVVGGSGALFGMLGATVAVQMRSGRDNMEFLGSAPGRRMVMLIAFYLILGAIIPMISNTAHVGGLISGFAVTSLFLLPPRVPLDALGRWARAGWVVLFLGLVGWTAFPATRWDNLYARLVATAPADRAPLLHALVRHQQYERELSSRGIPPGLEGIVEGVFGSRYRKLVGEPKAPGAGR